jgi:SAM-dependent methyltransferase
MAPSLVADVLAEVKASSRILDPMMGSGTVVALGRAEGHRVTGVDIDPLAVLISSVWTKAVDRKAAMDCAHRTLARAKAKATERLVYPDACDAETRKFIRYWFDRGASIQLRSLAEAIGDVRDSSLRDLLWCAFSRLIIAKQAGASRAMDLAHSRPHLVFERGPVRPFSHFIRAVTRVVENCVDERSRSRGPAPILHRGDARKLLVRSNEIDLIMTSPPYLNAIDYMRCSKFSLVWMGYSISDLRELRSTSIGAEVGHAESDITRAVIRELRLPHEFPTAIRAQLTRYIEDLYLLMKECARVLTSKGRATFVIGDSSIRGTFIRNSRILRLAGEGAGLSLCQSQRRNLPANRRYLPPPVKRGRQPLNTRMRREVILTFKK